MDWAPYVATLAAVLAATVTGFFAWKTKGVEVTAPDKLADGFVSLVADLRLEIKRLNERVERLEMQRAEDIRHIAYLELQIDWVMKRLDEKTRQEFDAIFRPFK